MIVSLIAANKFSIFSEFSWFLAFWVFSFIVLQLEVRNVGLKNEEDLNEKQKSKLISVKEMCPRLAIMHKLKEKFRQIFENTKTNWLRALLRIGIWQQRAKKYFSGAVKTITNWLDEIIAYFDNRTTSGVVEGVNNKLKLIKRSAYGFRNFENYKNRCLLTWHYNC